MHMQCTNVKIVECEQYIYYRALNSNNNVAVVVAAVFNSKLILPNSRYNYMKFYTDKYLNCG